MTKTSRRRDVGGSLDPALTAELSRRLQQALFDTIVHIGGDEADQPTLTVPRARAPTAPALLASAHPGGTTARRTMHDVYERCLAHYRTVVRAHEADAEFDDVGAAAAYFVATNLCALHGTTATPAALLSLERQLANIVRTSPAWADASARERQLYFEKLAILAVLVGETSAQAALQGPAAVENVRRAARGYLHELLGLDPDRITIGAGGLALRSSAASTSAA